MVGLLYFLTDKRTETANSAYVFSNKPNAGANGGSPLRNVFRVRLILVAICKRIVVPLQHFFKMPAAQSKPFWSLSVVGNVGRDDRALRLAIRRLQKHAPVGPGRLLNAMELSPIGPLKSSLLRKPSFGADHLAKLV